MVAIATFLLFLVVFSDQVLPKTDSTIVFLGLPIWHPSYLPPSLKEFGVICLLTDREKWCKIGVWNGIGRVKGE